MYNVSEFFYSKVKEPSRDIDAKVIIGDTELGTEEIIEFTIDSSFGNDEMPVIGSCIAKEMKLKLVNDENVLPYSIINTPIKPWVAIKVNDEYEWVPMGTFYATTGDITKTDLEVEISSFDLIGYLSNYEIETDLSYPTDVLNLIEEIEDKYSITINRDNIQPYEIPVKPKGKLRTVLGYIASLFTCNCITNLDGEVAFVTITDTEHTEFSLENYFQSEFYVSEIVRSIEYDIFQLNSDQFIDFKLLNEAPVEFTKLMVEKESPETEGEEDPEDKNLYFGTANGFTVSIENDFIETEEQLQTIYERKYPLTFVPYELNLQGMPHLEVGDNIRLIDDKHDDREPVVRNLIIGEHKFTYNGSLVSKIVMTSPRTESDTIDNTSTSQVVQTIKRNTPDMSDAINNATNIITGNEGGNIVTRFDENGQPYEMLIMNTPDIDTATRVWRWNQNGLGFSDEGYNGTYGLAMTSDGSIVADFINTGTLNAEDVNIINLNADNITSGTISSDKVTIGSGTTFEEGYNPADKVDGEELGDMAYENVVEESKLGSTVILGGLIRTELLSASRITTGTLNGNNVNVTNLNASNIKAGVIDGITYSSPSRDGTLKLSNGQLEESFSYTSGGGTISGEYVLNRDELLLEKTHNFGGTEYKYKAIFSDIIELEYDMPSQYGNTKISPGGIEFQASSTGSLTMDLSLQIDTADQLMMLKASNGGLAIFNPDNAISYNSVIGHNFLRWRGGSLSPQTLFSINNNGIQANRALSVSGNTSITGSISASSNISGNIITGSRLVSNGFITASTSVRAGTYMTTGTYLNVGSNLNVSGDINMNSSSAKLVIGSDSNNYIDESFRATCIHFNRSSGPTGANFRIRSNSHGQSLRNDFMISSSGNTTIFGDLSVNGNKNVIQNTETYGKRLMNALETPDSRFVAYQEYRLEEGEHWIEIEPMYLETIVDYFIVPHIQNASEVVMLERRDGKFRVWVHGHTAEVVFEINGKRKGFENIYMEKFEEADGDGEN